MAANWQPKPIYCPRRHGIECDTPNVCAGGAVCRFGPDPATQRRIFSFRSLSKISLLNTSVAPRQIAERRPGSNLLGFDLLQQRCRLLHRAEPRAPDLVAPRFAPGFA